MRNVPAGAVGGCSSSISPTRGLSGGVTRSRSLSPGFSSGSSCSEAVEAALERRRRQVRELKSRVASAEDRATCLRQRADTADDDRRRVEQELNNAKEEQEHMSVVVRCIAIGVVCCKLVSAHGLAMFHPLQ